MRISESIQKSEEQPMAGCPTMSVPEAGREYLDLGRDASYQAARRGELPVIRIGARMRVPRVAMERMMQEAGQK